MSAVTANVGGSSEAEPRALRIQYGGTFDPVHHGHIAVARGAQQALSAEVHLMPAADPPHKDATHASASQRAAMLRLAIAGLPGLHVDLRELRRAGASWTVDSLHELRAELGAAAPLAILIGADSLLRLNTWHRWRDLFALAHIVVAQRPGSDLQAGRLPAKLALIVEPRWASAADLLRQPAGLLHLLRLPLRPESATELRRRIAAGEPWRQDVPPAVAQYILTHGLYRQTA